MSTVQAAVDGVWLAYYSDWSDWRVFHDELSALRHAVGTHMDVCWLTFGEDPKEATTRRSRGSGS